MNKQRIFFLLPYMYIGGVEKSFLSFIDTLPLDRYEIHLGLLRMDGNGMDSIPRHVLVHHIECTDALAHLSSCPPSHIIADYLKRGKIAKAYRYLDACIRYKFKGTQDKMIALAMRDVPSLDIDFDVAVAYAGPSPLIDYYICHKVNAAKRIGWIHFDISKCGCDKLLISQLYPLFDHINIVSRAAKDVFDRTFPNLSNKTRLLYNVVDSEGIHSVSLLGPKFPPTNALKLLTIGRLSYEKGQQLAIEAAAELKRKGVDFVWYLVGDGAQMHTFREKAKSLAVSDCLAFVGAVYNPYGYFADCDIYVQPSLHEGYCITLAEALCFNKPIVSTRFCGAEEQLDHVDNALICEPTSVSIAKSIMIMIERISKR